MPPVNLDRWVCEPLVRTSHRRESLVGERELWAVAGTVRLHDCRILGRLIQARIPGVRSSQTFHELFAGQPFNVLDEGPTYRLSGLCGRIWTVRGDFAMLATPVDFMTWDVPGTVRVLFANWVEPTREGSALVSEVRIGAVDRRGALRVRALQPFISTFQGLVGAEPLTLAVRRATSR